jgi:uncharacterized protein
VVVRALFRALAVPALLAGATAGLCEEPLPPPKAYFNDYAGVVSEAEAHRLDEKLHRFDEETSTQIVVAIFPKLPSPSLEDFTVRTAESWRVGRKDWDNGAVLFVFVDDRKMRIETGYGLEGALPDILAARILDEQVRPHLQAGDWAGGLEAGIDAIIAATRGEYTAPPRKKAEGVPSLAVVIIVLFLLLALWIAVQGARYSHVGRTYGGQGWRRSRGYWGGGPWGGGWSGGGGGFGGGGFGGGGGGFSGGGGSFGGGGASSSW